MAVHRVLKWEEYRNLAVTLKPATIFYARDPHPTCQPPWGLKLIFYQGFDGYIFTDYAEGEQLHKTQIPIRSLDDRDIPIQVEDIERFLQSQIGSVKVSPIWFPS